MSSPSSSHSPRSDRAPLTREKILAAALVVIAHRHGYPLVLTRGGAMLTIASHATSQALAEVSWYGGRAPPATHPPLAGTPPSGPRSSAWMTSWPQHDAQTPFAFGLELLIEALEARLDDSRAGEP